MGTGNAVLRSFQKGNKEEKVSLGQHVPSLANDLTTLLCLSQLEPDSLPTPQKTLHRLEGENNRDLHPN